MRTPLADTDKSALSYFYKNLMIPLYKAQIFEN
jgi:hypothetical protein